MKTKNYFLFRVVLLILIVLYSNMSVYAGEEEIRAGQNPIYTCLNSSVEPFYSKQFAYTGHCRNLDETSGCYYYDYRNIEFPNDTGFDQRGIKSFQVTFPKLAHQWAALAVRNPADKRFCWSGGAHIGRNPLAMTWSSNENGSGSKKRKNNFLLSEGGTLHVEGARVHNIHDAFLASSSEAGFDINHSWVSWNRDDFFEGYLHKLAIRNTLVDGTYTFISDPDGDCDQDKRASDKTIVIENSLIRIQRQPGPYGKHSDKWHWKVDGGHHKLWKLDSCDWKNWPQFILRNNVFLIEGPITTQKSLSSPDCNLALPGACDNPKLGNLKECDNNLFLYSNYHEWLDSGITPGPTPAPDNRFYNENNPKFLRNGKDCYQRLTDDPRTPGYADVRQLWNSLRQNWINQHTNRTDPHESVMTIPGVDYPVFEENALVQLINRKSALCIESDDGQPVGLRKCNNSRAQQFQIKPFKDGKLMGALLLKDASGAYLRTQDQRVIEADNSDSNLDTSVFRELNDSVTPEFSERWYVLPREAEPGGASHTYVIESDAIRRSYLRGDGAMLTVQPFYEYGESTSLPQNVFESGDDHALQWIIRRIEK
jgi:hypothetical protein